MELSISTSTCRQPPWRPPGSVVSTGGPFSPMQQIIISLFLPIYRGFHHQKVVVEVHSSCSVPVDCLQRINTRTTTTTTITSFSFTMRMDAETQTKRVKPRTDDTLLPFASVVLCFFDLCLLHSSPKCLSSDYHP